MREIDRDLIRGRHYGQRSCEPHQGRTHGCTDHRCKRVVTPWQPGAVPHRAHRVDPTTSAFEHL